jgi:hypothetical protein
MLLYSSSSSTTTGTSKRQPPNVFASNANASTTPAHRRDISDNANNARRRQSSIPSATKAPMGPRPLDYGSLGKRYSRLSILIDKSYGLTCAFQVRQQHGRSSVQLPQRRIGRSFPRSVHERAFPQRHLTIQLRFDTSRSAPYEPLGRRRNIGLWGFLGADIQF